MNALTARSQATLGSVGAVSVISTGTVRIRPEHPYGTRKPLYWWLLTSREWTPPRPVNVYVIEHANGLILFDTGQDRASVTDDADFPGGFTGYLYHRLARFDIGEQDTLTAQLATLGYTPADVDTAVLSHLHEDHIGGLAELTGAELVVSAAEWAELAKPAPELRGFLRDHIQLPGRKWHQVSLEPTNDPALAPFTESLDVMGDGSLVLLPTPKGPRAATAAAGPGRAARPRPNRRPAAAGKLTRETTWKWIGASPWSSAGAPSGSASERRAPAIRSCCLFSRARACRCSTRLRHSSARCHSRMTSR
jgi:N-acyl homoserine lactone hydrolase